MELLEKCRAEVRTKSAAFDEELLGLIEACKLDLKIAGIKVKDGDALIERAILIYVKANFGIENKDFEKLNAAYEMLKINLGLSGDYNVEQNVQTGEKYNQEK